MTRFARLALVAAIVATMTSFAMGSGPVDAHERAERILYSAGCDEPPSGLTLRMLHPDTGDTMGTKVTETDIGARVSNDGWHLAIATPTGILITDADGTGGELLSGTTGASLPSWSPDDSQIAFVRNGQILVVGYSPYAAPVAITPANGSLQPINLDWSGDGSTLLWSLWIGAASTPTIETVAVADGARVTLRAGSNAWYSVGSDWIAYTTPSGWIATMDADGSNPSTSSQKGMVGGVEHDGIAFKDRRTVNGYLGDYIGIYSWNSKSSIVLLDADPGCDTNFYVWDWAKPRLPSFTDVPYDHLFSEHIEWLAHAGITKGCNPPDNTLFCPNDKLTRGEFAAFMVRAFDLPPGPSDQFVDDDDSVFEDAIDRLAAAGITRGCNPPANDRFCPNGTVTRGQIAAFLVRTFGFTDNGGGDLFDDDDDSIFENDIDLLATAGVTKGCNPPANNHFCPDNPITRGQMAAMFYRELAG